MVNITNSVLMNLEHSVSLSTPVRSLLKYYLNSDLDCLLGRHIFSEEDIVDLLKAKINDGYSIALQTIRDPRALFISIGSVGEQYTIVGKLDEEEVFAITGNNIHADNNVTFDEDIYKIEEEYQTAFADDDALSFRLSRKENGELLYDGSLNSIGSKIGDKHYFDYRSNMPVKVEESRKTTKVSKSKILNALRRLFVYDPTVGVKTSRNDVEIYLYADSVFKSLKDRLESEYPRKKDPNVVVKTMKTPNKQ